MFLIKILKLHMSWFKAPKLYIQIWKVRPLSRKKSSKYLLKYVIYIFYNVLIFMYSVYIYVGVCICWNIQSVYAHMCMRVCIFSCWLSIFWQILKLFEKHRLQFIYINPPSEMYVSSDFRKKKTQQILSCTFLFLEGINFLLVMLSSKHRFPFMLYTIDLVLESLEKMVEINTFAA